MGWIRAFARCLWEKRLTVYIVVITVAVVWALTTVTVNQENTDRLARETSVVASDNQQQNEIISQVVANLEAETKARTAQGCANTADRQDTYRNALLNLISVALPKDAEGNPIPLTPAQQARIDSLRAQINEDLPHLVCPLDEGPIVIATPSTTAPGG